MAATGSSGDGIAQKSLTQIFGDAIQESVAPEMCRLAAETWDGTPANQRMASWPERDGMTDLQIQKTALDTLAERIQQDEAYHRHAANLFGSGSLAGIRDLGVPNNLRELQEKQREKDENFYALLSVLIENQMRELGSIAQDLDDMADKLDRFTKKLQDDQDQAFAQLDALEEELSQYERMGSLNERRVRELLRERGVKVPSAADEEVLYQLASREVPEIRHETAERQEMMETCERECDNVREQSVSIRETVAEVESRSCQGIYAEEDAELLEATKKRACGCLETARQHFERMEASPQPSSEIDRPKDDTIHRQTPASVADIATGFDL